MNNLIIKQVDFMGGNLLAIQEKVTGKIYTAINYVLRGLGFDEKQIEYQRDKWVEDKVISKGTLKFSGTLIKAKTGKDIWCISVNKLPLALAKINITPKIENEMPELAEKLEAYQNECADILAQAFLPQYQQSSNKKTLDLKAVSVIAKAPKGNMSIVLNALDKMGYDVEGLDIQPRHNVVKDDFTDIINKTIGLIDNMIYENIELAQYIAIDEENNFICVDFTRLYKEFIKYVWANNIDFDYLTEKDFKQQLKKVNYCITNRYVKKLKIFSPMAKQFCSKPVHCFKLDLEQLNNKIELKIL